MSSFWVGLLAAQTAAAADAKPADRRRRVLSILGGIALTLLIGGGRAHDLTSRIGRDAGRAGERDLPRELPWRRFTRSPRRRAAGALVESSFRACPLS
jgi:hypothetical protein